jgi:hypothetical protein
MALLPLRSLRLSQIPPMVAGCVRQSFSLEISLDYPYKKGELFKEEGIASEPDHLNKAHRLRGLSWPPQTERS